MDCGEKENCDWMQKNKMEMQNHYASHKSETVMIVRTEKMKIKCDES